MDRITQSQFNSWKKEEAGKLFFDWIKGNIKAEKIKLESISKTSLNCSQEDYYKKCVVCGINIRNWQDILEAKVDFIQGDEENEKQTKGNK